MIPLLSAEKAEFQASIEAACSYRFYRHGLYLQVPSVIFLETVRGNENYPLPDIAFKLFKKGKVEPFTGKLDANNLQSFSSFWIHEEEIEEIREYAESLLLQKNGPVKLLEQEKRAEILRKSAITVVDDLFQEPTPKNIERSSKIVGSFVNLIMQDPATYLSLSKLSSHDPYTLQHSVGTAVNAIILGKKAGVFNVEELNILGNAGLLHDIGKVKIDVQIINKMGPLDANEWEEMKRHPIIGFELVKDNSSVNERTKRIILEHHENKEGTGYPNRLRQDQVDFFSKIIHICDIFNALTTNRSYSNARSVFDALELIKANMRQRVDSELFEQLVLIYGGKL